MGLFDKFQGLATARRDLEALGIDPFGVEIERIISPTEGIIGGRHTILAGTNNYLGLTFHPECIAAAHRALDAEGTGTTGSRMANGSYSGHRRLEEELAAFYGLRDAIVFSTGYQANLGMLAGLTGPSDVVLLDADCHASIYDGCRLAGAEVIRFRHNDAQDLAKRMRRLGARAADALVVIEGIYSMLGDRAPLEDIVDVKREHGGYLLGAPPSPVIAVVLGDRVEALRFWSLLLQRGVYVNLMLPPATPNGVSLIRCSVSAAHASEQIDAVCAAFADLRASAGIVAAESDTGR